MTTLNGSKISCSGLHESKLGHTAPSRLPGVEELPLFTTHTHGYVRGKSRRNGGLMVVNIFFFLSNIFAFICGFLGATAIDKISERHLLLSFVFAVMSAASGIAAWASLLSKLGH